MTATFTKTANGRYAWRYPTRAAGEREIRQGTVERVGPRRWAARVDGHPDAVGFERTRGLAVARAEKQALGRTVSV